MTTHLANTQVVELAAVYGIATRLVDGNDVAAVLTAAEDAVARARAGAGPTLIEAQTTRWRGHFEGDPQKYRLREELHAMTERDPITAWRTVLENHIGVATVELDRIESEVTAAVAADAEEAEAMPLSDADGLDRHVYPGDPR
ncbi:thiamine pyrophosphate-dependent enzyme [Gordonia sp. NPDC127522]|uniref:thiamine pyrophosphate-dependent enzyme n=1 Tax=Gordonia sp. NPDC127522 TaxID=3345390 RepID=UPI003643D4AE